MHIISEVWHRKNAPGVTEHGVATPFNHDHAPHLVVSRMFSLRNSRLGGDRVSRELIRTDAGEVEVLRGFSGGYGWAV